MLNRVNIILSTFAYTDLKKVPKGETLLTIYLTPKVALSADVLEYTQNFFQLLQSNEAQS